MEMNQKEGSFVGRDQIEALETDDLAALSTAAIRGLTTASIEALSTDQLEAITTLCVICSPSTRIQPGP